MIRLLICQEEAYSTVGEREAKRKEVNRCQEGILFEVKKKCESKKKKKPVAVILTCRVKIVKII